MLRHLVEEYLSRYVEDDPATVSIVKEEAVERDIWGALIKHVTLGMECEDWCKVDDIDNNNYNQDASRSDLI